MPLPHSLNLSRRYASPKWSLALRWDAAKGTPITARHQLDDGHEVLPPHPEIFVAGLLPGDESFLQ
jgi:hypothetical protein